MKDEEWRMQKMTTENDREPDQEPSCEKRWVWNIVYIHNLTCIRDNKSDWFN